MATAPWGDCVAAGRAGSASGADSTDTGGTGPARPCRPGHVCSTDNQDSTASPLLCILNLLMYKTFPGLYFLHAPILLEWIIWQRILNEAIKASTVVMPTCQEPVEWNHRSPASKRASSPLGSPGLWWMDEDFSYNVKNQREHSSQQHVPCFWNFFSEPKMKTNLSIMDQACWRECRNSGNLIQSDKL